MRATTPRDGDPNYRSGFSRRFFADRGPERLSLVPADKRRGIRRTSFFSKTSGEIRPPAAERLHITPDRLCPKSVAGQPCWTVLASDELQSELKKKVDSLLQSNDHELYDRDQRVLSTWFELFLIGRGLDHATPTMVISCTSQDDCMRVNKLFKKNNQVPDFEGVRLIAMIGDPRTSVPLVRLASLSKAEDSSPSAPGRTSTLLRAGTLVYGFLGPEATLTFPLTVWIGDTPDCHHKAVIGGLLHLDSVGKVGLTVAHTPRREHIALLEAPAATHTQQDDSIVQNSGFPNGGSFVHQDLNSDQDNPSTVIGHVLYSSDMTVNHVDWALVVFHSHTRFSSRYMPPTYFGAMPKISKLVDLLTPRGRIRGTLSASPTNIAMNQQTASIQAWAISLDQEIKTGDCGCWAVDAGSNDLYGHVAYGHPNDKIAYIISAVSIVESVEDVPGIGRIRPSAGSISRPKNVERKAKYASSTTSSTSSGHWSDISSKVGLTRRQRWGTTLSKMVGKRSTNKKYRRLLGSLLQSVFLIILLGIFAFLYAFFTFYYQYDNSSSTRHIRTTLRTLVALSAELYLQNIIGAEDVRTKRKGPSIKYFDESGLLRPSNLQRGEVELRKRKREARRRKREGGSQNQPDHRIVDSTENEGKSTLTAFTTEALHNVHSTSSNTGGSFPQREKHETNDSYTAYERDKNNKSGSISEEPHSSQLNPYSPVFTPNIETQGETKSPLTAKRLWDRARSRMSGKSEKEGVEHQGSRVRARSASPAQSRTTPDNPRPETLYSHKVTTSRSHSIPIDEKGSKTYRLDDHGQSRRGKYLQQQNIQEVAFTYSSDESSSHVPPGPYDADSADSLSRKTSKTRRRNLIRRSTRDQHGYAELYFPQADYRNHHYNKVEHDHDEEGQADRYFDKETKEYVSNMGQQGRDHRFRENPYEKYDYGMYMARERPGRIAESGRRTWRSKNPKVGNSAAYRDFYGKTYDDHERDRDISSFEDRANSYLERHRQEEQSLLRRERDLERRERKLEQRQMEHDEYGREEMIIRRDDKYDDERAGDYSRNLGRESGLRDGARRSRENPYDARPRPARDFDPDELVISDRRVVEVDDDEYAMMPFRSRKSQKADPVTSHRVLQIQEEAHVATSAEGTPESRSPTRATKIARFAEVSDEDAPRKPRQADLSKKAVAEVVMDEEDEKFELSRASTVGNIGDKIMKRVDSLDSP